MTKATLSALTDTTIFENNYLLITATQVNGLIQDIIAFIPYDNGILSADTIYSGGTNLLDIFVTPSELGPDIFVTGGTYNSITGVATFTNNSGDTFNVTGFDTAATFTGGTVSGATNFLSNIYSGGTNLSNIFATTGESASLQSQITVLQGEVATLSGGTSAYTLNTVFNAYTGSTNTTLNGFNSSITANTANIAALSAATSGYTQLSLFDTYTGSTNTTLNTLQSEINTLSGKTDVFISGGTYSAGTLTLNNTTGGTFSLSGFSSSSSFTGGTVSGATTFTGGLSANTFSATSITGNTVYLKGAVYDSTGTSGTTGNILTETSTGVQWKPIPVTAGAGLYLFYNYVVYFLIFLDIYCK